MTKKEIRQRHLAFIELFNLGEIHKDTLIIGRGVSCDLDLSEIQDLEPNTIFENKGHVILNGIFHLNNAATFANTGHVALLNVRSINASVLFKNTGNVYLESLEGLGATVTFNNGDIVYMNRLRHFSISQ